MLASPRQAREAFAEVTPELRIYVAHAHGPLEVGDIAVVVAAGSRHRDEAFRACRAVIEGDVENGSLMAGQSVGIALSGGNVDSAVFARVLAGATA